MTHTVGLEEKSIEKPHGRYYKHDRKRKTGGRGRSPDRLGDSSVRVEKGVGKIEKEEH